jgi:hypothetical protein
MHGVDYERSKFSDLLARGAVTLKGTVEMLKPVVETLKVSQLALLQKGNQQLLQSVHRTALVQLLFSDKTVDAEILRYDKDHITDIRAELQRVITCSTLMRVITFFVTSVTNVGPSIAEEEMVFFSSEPSSKLYQDLSVVVLRHSPGKPEDVGGLLEDILQTPVGPQTQTLVKDSLAPERIEIMRQRMHTSFDTDFVARTTV